MNDRERGCVVCFQMFTKGKGCCFIYLQMFTKGEGCCLLYLQMFTKGEGYCLVYLQMFTGVVKDDYMRVRVYKFIQK